MSKSKIKIQKKLQWGRQVEKGKARIIIEVEDKLKFKLNQIKLK